jgi:AraC-like DNA-binding protein
MANPEFPDGERLAIVSQESALRRVADLVALDAGAGLVIMEIKNETALRSAVGRALEYLSQYEEVTVDTLSDDFCTDERPLEQMFADTFGKSLTQIQPTRRVVIVAPRFDQHSCHGISFLNRTFKDTGITFHLLQANRQGDGFAIEFVEPPSLRHSSQLVGEFGLTPGQRLVFVLEGGTPQIFWVLGTRRDGALRISKGPAVTLRALRLGSRLLLPDSGDGLVDFSLKDSTWRSRDRAQHTAKVIGVVDAGPSGEARGKVIFFTVCKNDQWGFRKREQEEFLRKWQREDHAAPSWRQIVDRVRDRKRRRAVPAAGSQL